MGKNSQGKEIGKGICQKKCGLYSARFVDRSGKRHEKYFKTVPEARNWLADAKYADQHEDIFVATETTVDEWFKFWIDNIVCDLAPNTVRNYRERYKQNIQPVIGKMLIANVKPMHCKKVLVQMDAEYAGSTIRQTYITMGTMFKAAKMNDIIYKHPMDGVRYNKPVRPPSDIKFLTREEQCLFLEAAKKTHNFYQFALVLETGLRTGELIGLTFDDIDYEARTLTVSKTMEFRYTEQIWRAGPPKTVQSYRTIPLTDTAYEILKTLRDHRNGRKESPLLSQELEYVDRRTGETRRFAMRDLVFINWRTGEPTKNSSYDTFLYKVCDKAGVKRFCMHALRHTYATRCVEYGVQPSVLKKLLGHASIKTTIDRYVHTTNESLEEAVKLFQKNGISA